MSETTMLALEAYDRNVARYGPDHPITLRSLHIAQQLRALDESEQR